MFRLEDEFDKMFFGDENPKVKAKKKLNAYYDLYGEDKMKLEDVLDGEDYYDYLMASGFADEVLAERRQKREAEEKGMLSQKAEELKEQKIKSDVKKAAALAEKEKQKAMGTYQDEREDYIPKDIEGKKKRAKQLMDKYGENLDISEMNHKDFEAYLNLQDVLSEAKVERMHDEEVKKRKNLEYGLIDNFTPLKQTLKDDKEFKDMLVGAEGIINYPYLDNNGYRTTGIGYLINDREVFLSQPWLYEKDDGTLVEATMEQKIKAYNDLEKLKSQHIADYNKERREHPEREDKGPFNYRYRSYKAKTRLRMPSKFIQEEYGRQVDEALKRVKTSFDRYNETHPDNKIYYKKLPADVLTALTELAYNVGHFNGRFESMLNALAKGDYDEAAERSERKNPTASATVKKRIQNLADVLRRHSKKQLDKAK